MAAAGVPGTWESSTERVPMTPAIAARLGAGPGDPAMRTVYTFLGGGKPVMLSVSWEPAALTTGTAIMLPEEGPHAGQGVVERMAVIGQQIAAIRAGRPDAHLKRRTGLAASFVALRFCGPVIRSRTARSSDHQGGAGGPGRW